MKGFSVKLFAARFVGAVRRSHVIRVCRTNTPVLMLSVSLIFSCLQGKVVVNLEALYLVKYRKLLRVEVLGNHTNPKADHSQIKTHSSHVTMYGEAILVWCRRAKYQYSVY